MPQWLIELKLSLGWASCSNNPSMTSTCRAIGRSVVKKSKFISELQRCDFIHVFLSCDDEI